MEKQDRPRKPPIGVRWKINSNRYGGRILALAGIAGIVLPLGLFLGARLLDLSGIENFIPLFLMKISIAVGATIIGLFILLLTVEFIQDQILDAYYSRNKKHRLPLTNGHYECPYCGARNLSALDKQCPICGKGFQPQ